MYGWTELVFYYKSNILGFTVQDHAQLASYLFNLLLIIIYLFFLPWLLYIILPISKWFDCDDVVEEIRNMNVAIICCSHVNMDQNLKNVSNMLRNSCDGELKTKGVLTSINMVLWLVCV